MQPTRLGNMYTGLAASIQDHSLRASLSPFGFILEVDFRVPSSKLLEPLHLESPALQVGFDCAKVAVGLEKVPQLLTYVQLQP